MVKHSGIMLHFFRLILFIDMNLPTEPSLYRIIVFNSILLLLYTQHTQCIYLSAMYIIVKALFAFIQFTDFMNMSMGDILLYIIIIQHKLGSHYVEWRKYSIFL